MEWHVAVDEVRNHTAKIMTPHGNGTGFLISHQQESGLLGIATAAHVVNEANYWQRPIRIQHAVSKKEIVLQYGERLIHIDIEQDTAAIIYSHKKNDIGFPKKDDIGFPKEPLTLTEKGRRVKVGVDIGWVGFPAINPNKLCFFNGRVSCWVREKNTGYYLVDGVAINGVSGGPAFTLEGKDVICNRGLVSAYIPNRTAGIATPGLCVVRDIEHARKTAQELDNMEDARRKLKDTESNQIQTPPEHSDGTLPA